AQDPRFATHAGRKANEDELDTEISQWTAMADKWEAANRLQGAGIAAAPVENLRDAIERDPQLSRHYQEVRQPSHPEVALFTQGEPIQEAGAYRRVPRAPMYGEHTDEMLDVLGLTAQE